MSSDESVIRGRIGSIFITHFIPDLQNFSITLKTDFDGGVPGSITLFIFSLFVVIDHTTKQLFEYRLCNSKSLSIILDFVKT